MTSGKGSEARKAQQLSDVPTPAGAIGSESRKVVECISDVAADELSQLLRCSPPLRAPLRQPRTASPLVCM